MSSTITTSPVYSEAKKIAYRLITMCGTASSEAEVKQALLDAAFEQHRTLQQAFLGMLKVFIEEYGRRCDQERLLDRRNAQAVGWALRVANIDGPTPYPDNPNGNEVFYIVPGVGFQRV